jgi:exocyst complex component 4
MGAGDSPLFVPVLRGNMAKTDSNEFDAFVPHLRRHCGRLIGRLLVIANCISMIGEIAGQIVEEAGSSTDIRAFYRSCLSALHGEVKNWLACLLHGSKTTQRVYSSSAVAIVETLKGKKSGTDASKAPLYQFVSQGDVNMLPKLLDTGIILTSKDDMAARKLATMLVVDPFSASKQDVGHRAIVKPNLQYLAILYRPFAQLEHWLQILFPDDQKDGQFVDATFVENVLSEEYIPAIENYAVQELTRVFNSAEALLWHPLLEVNQTLAIGKGANSLLVCISTFVGLISQVACVLHQIPGSQTECEQVMLNLMSQFLERCDAKFRELVTSKTTEDTSLTFIAISSSFVSHVPLRDLLKQHSMLAGAEDELMDTMLAQKESLLLERLKSDRSLHRNEIIFDYRILRSVALLQRSLELLPKILADSNLGTVPSFPLFRPEFRPDENGKLLCNFFDGANRGVMACSPAFETAYVNFIASVQRLSETCLFTLRTELRVHCFYFLDLAYREGNYDFEESSNEPDPYVSNLANDLIRFEAFVAEWLPYSRYHVVMDELHESLASMLIADFRYIRSLNPFGCHKLEMNVATLEQILSLISTSADLQSARLFYRLASAGPERFIEMAPTLPIKFTIPQYQSIFDVYYRDNTGDVSLRRTYNNQLVRLKYLLEGTESKKQ